MACDEFAKQIKAGGFIFKAEADSGIICLPSDSLYIEACEEGCSGLRWSVSSDSNDTERVRDNLSRLLDAMSSKETGFISSPTDAPFRRVAAI